MKPYLRRRDLEKIVRDTPLVQFGQADQQSVMYAGHSTGCTHVELQRAHLIWHGKEISIDRISEIAGYTEVQRRALKGLSAYQVSRVIRKLNLPYNQPQFHGDPQVVVDTMRHVGPVILAVGYDMYPQLEDGDHYTGGRPTGKPNGYAIVGGRSDLGFTGGHCVTGLTVRYRRDIGKKRPRVCDPDHGSAARPEVYPYDIMTEGQLKNLVHSGVKQFGVVVAYLPTREWTGQGKGA